MGWNRIGFTKIQGTGGGWDSTPVFARSRLEAQGQTNGTISRANRTAPVGESKPLGTIAVFMRITNKGDFGGPPSAQCEITVRWQAAIGTMIWFNATPAIHWPG